MEVSKHQDYEFEEFIDALTAMRFMKMPQATFYKRMRNGLIPPPIVKNGIKLGWTKSMLIDWQQVLLNEAREENVKRIKIEA